MKVQKVCTNIATVSFLLKPLLIVQLAASIFGCRNIEAPEPVRTRVDSTLVEPISQLNVPVFYPIQELENLLNEKLENKIIEAPIAINQKGDSLFLTISKFRTVSLAYDGNHTFTYQLPLQITGVVQGKILGIGIKNKTPVETKVLVTLRSELSVDNRWHLVTKTSILTVKWIEQPQFHIAGLSFNLKSSVEKMLFKNEEKITNGLDKAITGVIKIEKSIEKLWNDLQKPITINKKVQSVWLKADPVSMSERIMGQSKDTLTIELSLKTKLHTLLDTSNLTKSVIPFGMQENTKQRTTGLDAYLLATVPFENLNQMIKQVTDTMTFNFQGHEVRIKDSELYGTLDGLAVRIDLVGDVKARLYLTGKLGYDSLLRNLVLTDFGFDVNSEQSLVHMADWFSHDEIVNRVQPYLSLSVGSSIEALPSLIFQGVEKGKLGEKIEVYFSNFDATLFTYLITHDNIQVIIHVTGRADIQLQRKLFVQKKMTALP